MAWNKTTNPEKIKEYNKQYYLKKTKAKREALKKEKVKEAIVKVCPICNKEFTTTSKKTKYCSDECHMKYTLAHQKERRKTKEYRDKIRDYYKSESYKNSQAKYANSEKGKEAKKRYYEKKKETV